MREFRVPGITLGVAVAVVVVTAFVLGPLTWWLTPAENDQFGPVDRLHLQAAIRDDLVQLLVTGVIATAVCYFVFAVLRYGRNR